MLSAIRLDQTQNMFGTNFNGTTLTITTFVHRPLSLEKTTGIVMIADVGKRDALEEQQKAFYAIFARQAVAITPIGR